MMTVITAVSAAKAPHPVKVIALMPEPLGFTSGVFMPAAFCNAMNLSAVAEELMSDTKRACTS